MIVPRVSCMPVRAQQPDALRRSSAARLAVHVRGALRRDSITSMTAVRESVSPRPHAWDLAVCQTTTTDAASVSSPLWLRLDAERIYQPVVVVEEANVLSGVFKAVQPRPQMPLNSDSGGQNRSPLFTLSQRRWGQIWGHGSHRRQRF